MDRSQERRVLVSFPAVLIRAAHSLRHRPKLPGRQMRLRPLPPRSSPALVATLGRGHLRQRLGRTPDMAA